MKKEKIHNHPGLEKKLGIGENHVIIDKEIFDELRSYNFSGKKVEVELTEDQIKMLKFLHCDPEMCYGYDHFEDFIDKTRKEMKKDITFLRLIGLVEYINGCMNEEGVAGSGFCRSEKGNAFIGRNKL